MIKMIKIKGIQKTSMIDYPDKISTILFTPGCNFRCPFCYNEDLVINHDKLPEIDPDEIIDFLRSRKQWIDGVCITGGEPLLFEDIGRLLKRIKDTGLLIKLDTNGTNPKVLKQIIDDKLVDYIAMDIKNSFEKYDETTGVKVDITKIKESIRVIMNSGAEYEFRTTTIRKFHTKEDFIKISEVVKGAKNYYLQNFKPAPTTIDKDLKESDSFKEYELEEFKRILQKNVNKVKIRNV